MVVDDATVELDMGAEGGSRTLRIAAAGSATGNGILAANTEQVARWQLADLVNLSDFSPF